MKPSLTIFTASPKHNYNYYDLFLNHCCNAMKEYNPVKLHIICNSIDDYSLMMASGKLNVQTDFFLIIQSDGFIVNPKQWTDDFFQYDYIGAPFPLQNKNSHIVGNGGFCLRSKKLNDALRDIYSKEKLIDYSPEDVYICITKRKQLENKYGIKFAPYNIASKFSVEHETYNNQFGFHGRKMFNHGYTVIDDTYQKITNNYFEKKKIVIYTCITGGYDNFNYSVKKSNSNIDYVLFTDDMKLKPKGWIIKPIPSEFKFFSTQKQSKLVKILSHRYFPEYDLSIYIDGNSRISKYTNLSRFINELDFDNHFLFVRKHPTRQCLYDEQIIIERQKIDSENDTDIQIQRYRDEGFPEKYGLTENNVLIRNHNDPDCQRLMESWAREVVTWSFRDQLSFMYCVWKLGLKDKIGYLDTSIYNYKLQDTDSYLFYKGNHHNKKPK